MVKQTITLTAGDRAENHKGMQIIGEDVGMGGGYSPEELRAIQVTCEEAGDHCEYYDLSEGSEEEAGVLVLENGVDLLMGRAAHAALLAEQVELPWDEHALMYERVVKKHARRNLCYDTTAQEPDYKKGRGRIVAFDTLPLTNELMTKLPDWFGEKARDLKLEGNYYYDNSKCGIGFHGDSERRKVIAVRLGDDMPIWYQWYHRSKPVGTLHGIPLPGGSVYLMSEKAVGTDWKSPSKYTLRHAAGASKYTKLFE
jgi:hypothetical protein